MKHVWIISCLLFVCSCNTVREDFVVNEDYEKLFPSKEIEKPENKRGELLVQLCDPDQALGLLSAIYLYKQIISFGDIAYNTLHDISLPRLFTYATIGKTR